MERKSSVCGGDDGATPREARRTPRASSISAAVPEALSFAPGPSPVLSRWAMTTIASGERPSTANEMFWSRLRPTPGIVASKTSLRCVGRAQRCLGAQKPKNRIFSVSQRTAPADARGARRAVRIQA